MTKVWLHETHGPLFELFRHFLSRFLDSDVVLSKEQTPTALIGAAAVLTQWIFLYVQPVREKYQHLSRLVTPAPYRDALRADELWLITLTMSAMALLTVIKWRSLLPGRQDLRSLASLPVRPGQVFLAKLFAMLAVSLVAAMALNVLPGVAFPALSAGRWAFNPSLGRNILAHTAACLAGGYFAFFALVALQGVLLTLLRPGAFRQVTGVLQAILAAGAVSALVLSFSIEPQVTARLVERDAARWVPPVWFLGLRQALAGDPDPAMHALGRVALLGLGAVAALSATTYAASYMRRRTLLAEGMVPGRRRQRWTGPILDWFVPCPRQQAVVSFLWKTFANSSQHRMILMAYAGFGLALLLTSVLAAGRVFEPAWVMMARFVAGHVVLLIFALLGLRHLFSIPVELGANWLFRITEREGRRDWMRALDRLILFSGAAAVAAIPFPFEAALLGWRAVPEALLFLVFGLVGYECAFASWAKLPFTCSYLPGKKPAWLLAVGLLGLLTALPILTGIMVWCLYHAAAYAALVAVLVLCGQRMRAAHRANEAELRLLYEELPDPEIHGLGLLQ